MVTWQVQRAAGRAAATAAVRGGTPRAQGTWLAEARPRAAAAVPGMGDLLWPAAVALAAAPPAEALGLLAGVLQPARVPSAGVGNPPPVGAPVAAAERWPGAARVVPAAKGGEATRQGLWRAAGRPQEEHLALPCQGQGREQQRVAAVETGAGCQVASVLAKGRAVSEAQAMAGVSLLWGMGGEWREQREKESWRLEASEGCWLGLEPGARRLEEVQSPRLAATAVGAGTRKEEEESKVAAVPQGKLGLMSWEGSELEGWPAGRGAAEGVGSEVEKRAGVWWFGEETGQEVGWAAV